MNALVVESSSASIQAAPANKKLKLWGVSGAETAASAAVAECVVRHGTDATGSMLWGPMNFAADGFCYPTFLPHAIACPNGIFVERRAGTTTLILYVDYE